MNKIIDTNDDFKNRSEKTLGEKIEVMTHYYQGGLVEIRSQFGEWRIVEDDEKLVWNWDDFDYNVVE